MSVSQYVTAFISILTLFAFLFALLKASHYLRMKKFSGDISIIDRIPLDANSSVMIVKVRQKEYLLGVGNKDIKVLDQL